MHHPAYANDYYTWKSHQGDGLIIQAHIVMLAGFELIGQNPGSYSNNKTLSKDIMALLRAEEKVD